MKTRTLTLLALALSVGGLAYTFAGYGWLMKVLRRRGDRLDITRDQDELPHLTVVVVAHNEGGRIAARLANLLESDYPADKFNVLVVSDGSTDDTVAKVQSITDHRITILARSNRMGKAACLNAAMRQVTAEVVVFADARQRFDRAAILRLAGHFVNPCVGAVSGELEIESARSSVGSGVDSYWRMEKALRKAESDWDSSVGCTGAIYAIRRALFEPIPDDTLLDDVVIPMQIAVRGFRVLHDPAALAFDPQSLEPEAEQVRKRRTLAGNFQMLFRYPGWLLPWRNRLWWQLISHKYLRLLSPVLLAQAFVSTLLIAKSPIGRLALLGQLGFYALAVLGAWLPGAKSRLFSLPSAFVFLNLGVLRGFRHFLKSRDLQRWEVGGRNSAPLSVPQRRV